MRVVFPLGSRANFGSLKSVMLACKRRGAIVLPVLYASATDWRYGSVKARVEADGHDVASELPCHVDNAMAFTTGAALMQWSALLPTLRADAVVVVGDRHEQMAPALAASYAGVTLVHTMGGEVSGNIDDRVRGAITALADRHCVATQAAGVRVARLIGAEPRTLIERGSVGRMGGTIVEYTGAPPVFIGFDGIHVTGCPRIDMAKEAIGAETRRGYEPIIMVSQHPVTTEHTEAYEQMKATLAAVETVARTGRQRIELFWPNSDAGTDGTTRAIREWLNDESSQIDLRVRTHRAMPPEDYARMMAACKVLVGNSSSGLREGSWIGTPVVNIGDRQRNREHGHNVFDVPNSDLHDLARVIGCWIDAGPHPYSDLYGDGTAGEKVADVILGTERDERRAVSDAIRARL